MSETAIVWFRQDLRIADNPALNAALDQCARVIPLYIHTDNGKSDWALGAASRWWLHHSLQALDQSLRALGSRLIIRKAGDSLDALRALIEQTGASHVTWNRLYEPGHIARDKTIKQSLQDLGIAVESFNSALLYEPWEIAKNDGGPFRVFTPFWKSCVNAGLPSPRCHAPDSLPAVSRQIKSDKLESLELLPKIRWDGAFAEYWQPGETGAQDLLDRKRV